MAAIKNDCYKCQFRGKVSGSAHSTCSHPLAQHVGMEISMLLAMGKLVELNNKKEAKTILSFNPHGVKHGWCFWPLNFDPVWVTCNLNLEKSTKEDNGTKSSKTNS